MHRSTDAFTVDPQASKLLQLLEERGGGAPLLPRSQPNFALLTEVMRERWRGAGTLNLTRFLCRVWEKKFERCASEGEGKGWMGSISSRYEMPCFHAHFCVLGGLAETQTYHHGKTERTGFSTLYKSREGASECGCGGSAAARCSSFPFIET